jgi:hypothetical protein
MITKHYYQIAIITIQRNQIFKIFNNNFLLEKRKTILKITISFIDWM